MDLHDCVFLANILDPRRPDLAIAEKYMSPKDADEQETRKRLTHWLKSKTIAEPAASPFEDTAALEAQGYIGVYFCSDHGDTRLPAQAFDPDELRQVDDVTLLSEVNEEMRQIQKGMQTDEE